MLQKGPALCVKRRSSVSKEEEGEPLLDNKLHRIHLFEFDNFENEVHMSLRYLSSEYNIFMH